MIDWRNYKNFSKWEFDCSHTGENNMRSEFMEMLQQIRSTFGKPMVISSGYRDWTHPVEINKDRPGEHTYGLAADIKVYGIRAFELADIAFHHGIRRIGFNQKGPLESRFIHLGMGDKQLNFPATIWTY